MLISTAPDTVNAPLALISPVTLSLSDKVVTPVIDAVPVTLIVSSTVTAPFKLEVPVTKRLLSIFTAPATLKLVPILALVTDNTSMLERSLLLKLICPSLSLICPSEMVIFPKAEPLAAVIVELTVAAPVTSRAPVLTIPDVVNELSLKFIALLESVILPLDSVKAPICDPLAEVKIDEDVIVPFTLRLPVVTSPDAVNLLLIVVSPSIITSPPKCDNPSLTHTDLALVIVMLFPIVGAPEIYTVEAFVVVTLSFVADKAAGLKENKFTFSLVSPNAVTVLL